MAPHNPHAITNMVGKIFAIPGPDRGEFLIFNIIHIFLPFLPLLPTTWSSEVSITAAVSSLAPCIEPEKRERERDTHRERAREGEPENRSMKDRKRRTDNERQRDVPEVGMAIH